MFRSDIAHSGQSPSAKKSRVASPSGQAHVRFWEDDNFNHVYEAMKKAREEIGVAITNRKLILFEAIPLNFSLAKHQEADDDDTDCNRCKLGQTNKW